MDEETPPASVGPASVQLAAAPSGRRLVRSYERGEFTVVELRGEIDLSTIGEVSVQVAAVTGLPGARVVVDLRPAQFFDCATLTLLVRTRRLLLERGGWMGLVCTHPWHLRILRLAGLTMNLRPAITVEDACARAPRKRAD